MADVFSLDQIERLDKPNTKRSYNRRLFTIVAPAYDFVTRALSLGRDPAWKKRLIEALPPHEAPVCVDLACGTGDLTLKLAERYPRGRIVGLDLNPSMLQIARRRCRFPNVRFEQADVCDLPWPDRSVDLLTGGYALRNAPDLALMLSEVRRVLRPGGVAAFLEFSRPAGRAAGRLEYWVLKSWGSFWGWFLHGDSHVYSYIAESLRRFPDRRRLRTLMNQHDLRRRDSRTFLLGVIELII
ncbi:MAG: ubiquinone/menaquinone biosynthesis methyltransferase, partial [Planctomycetes bacterium]|nr:ubiquinone/menaquinone biosynthesis methyltransferase [Planctomycetota bacterium]